MFYKNKIKVRVYIMGIYDPILERDVMHQVLVEANATCEEFAEGLCARYPSVHGKNEDKIRFRKKR
jgi:hypothetical protein